MTDIYSPLSKLNEDGDRTTTKRAEGEEESEFLATVCLMGHGMVCSVLKGALDLGVFQILADAGPDRRLTPREIVAQLPECHNPNAPVMLDRLLRLLATNSIVTCSVEEVASGGVERRYGLGPLAKFFIPNENGASLAPYLLMLTRPSLMDGWKKFNEAVFDGGIPMKMANGVSSENSAAIATPDPVFDEAISNSTTMTIHKMLQKYKGFQDINQLVHVGGGVGQASNAIVSQYPAIKNINFDLPHIVADAPPYHGVEHVGGDMFEAIPTGDAIFLKWILHNWDDEHCLKILKNCYEAVPENGKAIMVESIFTDAPEITDLAKVVSNMDVFMMLANGGSRERTRNEFIYLAKTAGFAGINFVCPVYQFWVMELYK